MIEAAPELPEAPAGDYEEAPVEKSLSLDNDAEDIVEEADDLEDIDKADTVFNIEDDIADDFEDNGDGNTEENSDEEI